MFSGVVKPKRGRGRPPKSKAPPDVDSPPAVHRFLLSDDEDDDYQPNWAATGVGFSQVVKHIGVDTNQEKAAPTDVKNGVEFLSLDKLATPRPSSAGELSLHLDLDSEQQDDTQSSPLPIDSPSLCDLDSVQQPATNSSAEERDEADSDEEDAPLEVDEGEESALEDDAIPATPSIDDDNGEDSFAVLNTTAEEEEKPTACGDVDGNKSAEVEHIDIKLKVLRKRKEIASVELKLLEKKARLYELKNAE